MSSDTGEKHYLHKEHPKTKAADDFWGQVSRTVNGKPVSEDDILLIVNAIEAGLRFEPNDVLLDIGCGNGALSRYFFDSLASFKGVDFSEYLIKIAKDNFEDEPDFSFLELDAASYVQQEAQPERYTKVLCYGVFAYFPELDARTVLSEISTRFSNVSRFFIGNLPDRNLAHKFYREGQDYSALLDDPFATIGIWRTREEFAQLASECGWSAEFSQMPDSFYSSHYRYDVTLTRNNK